MNLKVRKETIFTIDSSNFDDFVSKYFNRNFSIVANEELSDGGVYRTVVDGQLTELDRHYYQEWLQGNDIMIYFKTHILFNMMFLMGILKEKGDYVVEVNW